MSAASSDVEDIYGSDNEHVDAIVDIAVLEAAKENIQPLAKGRRVTSLASVLATPHAQRDVRLAATRAKHRANVEAALEGESTETPLEAYARFVHWTIEHYPRGHSAESGILELLEEATRVLKDEGEGRNKGEKSYLELWLLYAGYVDRPGLVYAFCLANEIGTGWARLYEEYAMWLERSGNKTKADEIYLLGIARQADPLEHLQNRHREFQKRMMTSMAAPTSITDARVVDAGSSANAQPGAQRQVLGTTKKPIATRRTASSSRSQQQDDVFAARASRLSGTSSSTSSNAVSRPNGRLAVFLDPEGNAELDGSNADTGNAWTELETKKVRVKENVKSATKMAETTLKGKGKKPAVVGKAKGGFVVFKDVDDGEDQDESAEPSPAKEKANGKGKFTILCDETEESAPAKAMKKKFAVFCDDDEGQAQIVKQPKNTGSEKKKFAVFCDEEEETLAQAPAPTKGGKRFAVFCDDEDESGARTKAAPATPRFVPFKDEIVSGSPTGSNAPETVMKPKGLKESSEAEALRKNPFKNYREEERPALDE